MALELKYYQGQAWHPEAGDYYTICRSDLELYQLKEYDHAADTVVFELVSEDQETFPSTLNMEEFYNEFHENRVHVPEFIFEYQEPDHKPES